MEIHIINIFEKYFDLSEPVYDVLINNDCLLRIRDSIYQKWKKGKYIVDKQGCEYVFIEKETKKLVDRLNVGVY